MSMPMRPLGRTDIQVSQICLGSMTWGTQNTAGEAFEQIDCALDQGVNFIDTAEMYPTTPLSEATQGRTEEIIGDWFARSGRRKDVILATKVTGAGPQWIQGGRDIDRQKIQTSIEHSLQRLQSDYIDLYQLHWPNRGSYHFRQSWRYDPTAQPDTAAIEANLLEVLQTLDDLVKAGKIRHAGLSNETAWGTQQFLRLAEAHRLPRMASVQNEYSLLQRLFDLDLAEVAHHEQVGLLAFSPLAAGLLSGKYADGALPRGSRRTMNDDLSGPVTFEPYRSQLTAAGATILFDSTQIPGEIVDVIAVRESALDEQRAAVQALLAGWFKAIGYLQEEPSDAARRMSRRQQTSAEQFLRALAGLHIPSREENLVLLGGDSPGLVTSGAHLMTLMIDARLLQQPINIKEVLEPGPLQALSP